MIECFEYQVCVSFAIFLSLSTVQDPRNILDKVQTDSLDAWKRFSGHRRYARDVARLFLGRSPASLYNAV